MHDTHPLERYIPQIYKAIVGVLEQADSTGGLTHMAAYHFRLVDALGQSIGDTKLPGKAIRPALACLTYEALGGNIQDIVALSTTLELIHNFSLIHDDIQDMDETRHGQKTVWKVFGQAQAINAGDFLLMKAMKELHKLRAKEFSPDIIVKVSEMVIDTTLHLVEGQYLDISFEERVDRLTVHDYLMMIAGKTGAMIITPIVSAAFLHGEDVSEIKKFHDVGFALGRVFQIQDDYLGIWGNPDTTGKPIYSDILRWKKTYPVIYALEHARGKDKESLLHYYTHRQKPTTAEIAQIVSILEKIGAQQATEDAVRQYAEEATTAIDKLPIAREYKNDFCTVTDFFQKRDH